MPVYMLMRNLNFYVQSVDPGAVHVRDLDVELTDLH